MELTFANLARENAARCDEVYYPIEEWSETDWATAFAGEAGEACNLIKKRRRGERIPSWRVVEELADAVIYADLLCQMLGISLESAVRKKFNETSQKHGSKRRL